MNYYEQFYDDLEFCEEESAQRHDNRQRHWNNYDDTEENWTHRDQDYPTWDQHWDQGRGQHHQDRRRPAPYYMDSRGDRGKRGNYNSVNERDNFIRGSGGGNMNRGRGQQTDGGQRSTNRGRGSFERGGQRGPTGGQRGPRGGRRGTIGGFVKFVKASSPDHDKSDNSQSDNKIGQSETPVGRDNSTIRFDYNAYMKQPTSTEQEVAVAMNVYSHPVLSSYGYGPGSDFQEFGARSLNEGTAIPQMNERSDDSTVAQVQEHITQQQQYQQQQQHQQQQQQNSLVKKAMVKPAFNFVKAGTEFKSTDVAFHETQSPVDKTKGNFVVSNTGNKRAGLGMPILAKGGSETSNADVGDLFYSRMMDGCNPGLDKRFSDLQQAVKVRNTPGKNGIEVLHMAVDKVRMKINDDITQGGRTQAGQLLYMCRLVVDGVFLAESTATAKKAAKHEAYTNAMNIFTENSNGLTVKEVAKGVFELKPKIVTLGLPPFTPDKPGTQQKQRYTPSQGRQTNLSPQNQQSTSENVSYPTSHIGTATYTKPKIVFHKSSHPLADEPLHFVKPDPAVPHSGSTSSPSALANKLLTFVKEGSSCDYLSSPSKPSQSSNSVNNFNPNWSNLTSQCQFTRPQALQINEKKRPLPLPEKSNFKHVRTNLGKKRMRATLDDLSQFIIIDNSIINPSSSDMSILHTSANFNKVILKLEFEKTTDGFDCSLILSDHTVSREQGSLKEDARLAAVTAALDSLREVCYTILIKQNVDADSGGLSKEELLGEIQKGGDVIPDSNIGNMLLRKMGWSGGGVGKDGKGIAEPVKASNVIGREGLGLKAEKEKHLGKGFHEKVQKLLSDYIKSNDQNDLHFSSELAKEERAIIHQMGQKLGLKTQSKGKGDKRFLIISRKRSAFELLEHVIGKGGTTSKYEVVPPTNTDSDPRKRDALSFGQCKQ